MPKVRTETGCMKRSDHARGAIPVEESRRGGKESEGKREEGRAGEKRGEGEVKADGRTR
jgi:hypothetical protein